MNLTVNVATDVIEVVIEDGFGGRQELVHWVSDEWEEDPSIVPVIANAVKMACEDPAGFLAKTRGG